MRPNTLPVIEIRLSIYLGNVRFQTTTSRGNQKVFSEKHNIQTNCLTKIHYLSNSEHLFISSF